MRLEALYALWYHHIIVTGEISCLGMSAVAADAVAEAFHLERTLMSQSPTVARLGTAQLGSHLLLDAPRAGSHRSDSRLQWTLAGEHGAWGDLGPDPTPFENLAADAEERNCTFRLRAAWEAVLLNFEEHEDLLRLAPNDARYTDRISEDRGATTGKAVDGDTIQISGACSQGESVTDRVKAIFKHPLSSIQKDGGRGLEEVVVAHYNAPTVEFKGTGNQTSNALFDGHGLQPWIELEIETTVVQILFGRQKFPAACSIGHIGKEVVACLSKYGHFIIGCGELSHLFHNLKFC